MERLPTDVLCTVLTRLGVHEVNLLARLCTRLASEAPGARLLLLSEALKALSSAAAVELEAPSAEEPAAYEPDSEELAAIELAAIELAAMYTESESEPDT